MTMIFFECTFILLFEDLVSGEEYFPSIQIGLFQLFVTWTGENFPDIMYDLFWYYAKCVVVYLLAVRMPAYTESRAMALLFVLFIIVNVYILQTILLGVIYDNYRRQAVVCVLWNLLNGSVSHLVS